MIEKEQWKEIAGHPDYFISNYGNVKSIKTNKILAPQRDKKGYLRVSIGFNPRVTKKIHRLVAIAFIPNHNNLPQVNHKDTNKQNNRLSNLEWCNNKMNSDHAILHGLHKTLPGSANGNAILTEQNVREIRAKSILGCSKPLLSAEYGVSVATIKDIRLRRTWAHI